MRLTESKLRRLIKKLLISEYGMEPLAGAGPSIETGKMSTDTDYEHDAVHMEPSESLYKELMGAEGHVPYVYDDKRSESTRSVDKKELKKIVDAGRSPKSGRIPKRLNTYRIAVGTPTIGIGHAIFQKGHRKYSAGEQKKYEKYLKGKDGYMNRAEAEKLFKEDVLKHSQFKDRIKAPISQKMFDALTSLAFNSGWESGKPIDMIIKLINKKNYIGAANRILKTAVRSKGEVIKGLQRRRKKERAMFLTGIKDWKKSIV